MQPGFRLLHADFVGGDDLVQGDGPVPGIERVGSGGEGRGREVTLLLPIDKAELFAAKLDLTDQPLVSWQAYRMRNGETVAQVAAKFGMPVESLRAVNGLGTKAKVPAGHTLLVPSARPTSADARSGVSPEEAITRVTTPGSRAS